ncbi:MAG TPA: DUF1345 domain-containing protein [Ginsengibacter sp.]|nr:DUF1345 domain-containing protein [Ginsengibacter sp.]HRP44092.1 DUF1345 domain-containing protein [Ginsengibacter sp.]
MKTEKKPPILKRIDSLEKLIISIVAGITCYLLSFRFSETPFMDLMIGWDAFSLVMVSLSWVTFKITTQQEIRTQAAKQDPKRTTVFLLVLFSTFVSVYIIVTIILQKGAGFSLSSWRLPVAIAGMVLSWLLIHTLFTLRYAHIYYGSDIDNPTNHAGGLLFPGNRKPEYDDFFYFSIVLGMTFQVSDVQITSPHIRKLATWHGLISFAYNTIIIALVINLMAV